MAIDHEELDRIRKRTRMIQECQNRIYLSKNAIAFHKTKYRESGKSFSHKINEHELKIRKEKAKLLLLGVSVDDTN